MRQYKLAIHILVVLSVFNFVLAAPVALLREARTDMADEGEDLIIVSGKRAEEGEYHQSTQAPPDSEPRSVQLSSSSQHPRRAYASGVHREIKNTIQLPSSLSGRAQLVWYSQNNPGTSSGSGGTGVPTSDSANGAHQGTTDTTQLPSSAAGTPPSQTSSDTDPHSLTSGSNGPGTTNNALQAASVRTKRPSSVRTRPNWGSTTGIGLGDTSSGAPSSKFLTASSMRTRPSKWKPLSEIDFGEAPPAPSSSKFLGKATSVRTKTNKWVPPTETGPAVSSSKVLPLPELITPASLSRVPSSESITPPSSSKAILSEPNTLPSSGSVSPPSEHITPASFGAVVPPASEPMAPTGTSSIKGPSSELVSPTSSTRTRVTLSDLFATEPLPNHHVSPPPGQEPKPQSKGFFSNLASNSKSFFSNLAGKFKNLFSKLAFRPKI